MSLIKKSDVKNHLSAHRDKGNHLYRPVSQPDATGFSGVEAGPADPNTDLPIVIASSSSDAVAMAAPKSAQA